MWGGLCFLPSLPTQESYSTLWFISGFNPPSTLCISHMIIQGICRTVFKNKYCLYSQGNWLTHISRVISTSLHHGSFSWSFPTPPLKKRFSSASVHLVSAILGSYDTVLDVFSGFLLGHELNSLNPWDPTDWLAPGSLHRSWLNKWIKEHQFPSSGGLGPEHSVLFVRPGNYTVIAVFILTWFIFPMKNSLSRLAPLPTNNYIRKP